MPPASALGLDAQQLENLAECSMTKLVLDWRFKESLRSMICAIRFATMSTKQLSASSLHEPTTIGAWELPNRMIMAPLTRCRASEGRVPNTLMAEYYSQRASAGMIISEATSVCAMGVGYPNTPGIWSEAQIEGWKLVTEAVHRAGGRILLQLWHVGRVSGPLYLDGELPVAPSAVQPAGHVSLVRPMKPFVTPRAPRAGGDRRRHRSLSPRSGECEASGIRRRGDPRRERLPAGPVPPG